MTPELKAALDWHAAGATTSPNAPSVQHTAVLVAEIESLKVSVLDHIQAQMDLLDREGRLLEVVSSIAEIVGLNGDETTPEHIVGTVRQLTIDRSIDLAIFGAVLAKVPGGEVSVPKVAILNPDSAVVVKRWDDRTNNTINFRLAPR